MRVDAGGGPVAGVADLPDRVDLVTGRWVQAGYSPPYALTAVLVRPDGYVAWAAPGSGEVAVPLGRWFGAAPARLAASGRP